MPTQIPVQMVAGLLPKAGATDDNQIDPEIARLRSNNSLYAEYAGNWEMYVNAYEGGTRFANIKNLFQHQRENIEDFTDRGNRVHYFNYCGPLVDFFTNFIFSETIQRDGGSKSDWYQTFLQDVNKKGDSISDFMREISDDAQIYGMVWIEVSTPRSPAGTEVVTKQQEEDLNIRPYWVYICPLEVLDWSVDEFDKLQYLKRKQISDGLINGIRVNFEKYTEWYRDRAEITLVDVTDPNKPKIIGAREIVPNKLGEIPIHLTRFKRSKRFPYMGESFLIDFALNNREVMNYTSLLQEFFYRQCFNILAKEVDTSVPMRDQQDGNLGTSNVLEYPKGAATPAYISPPVAPAKFIQDERQRIVNEMFKRAAQDTVNELFNGEKSSGFSQAQSFSKSVPFISSRADTLEKTENALMVLTMKQMNQKWDGKVKYKDHYEITNVTDALTQLTTVFRDLMLPSETFCKEELKRLVSELDGKISPDKMKAIFNEIEAMDFAEWQDTQKLALIGNAGNSPAAQQGSKSSGTMAEVAKESAKAPAATKKLKK